MLDRSESSPNLGRLCSSRSVRASTAADTSCVVSIFAVCPDALPFTDGRTADSSTIACACHPAESDPVRVHCRRQLHTTIVPDDGPDPGHRQPLDACTG